MTYELAPELQVREWLNSPYPITLEALRGRVVMIEAFQMLCPGCVSHGLPQAMEVAANFSTEDVVVLGLHTVFEHHEAQGTRAALEAFMHEYRIPFPVGIDQQSDQGKPPKTMQAFELRGTPSLILIDHQGRIRQNIFGKETDMRLGAQIMALVREAQHEGLRASDTSSRGDVEGCTIDHCLAPSASPSSRTWVSDQIMENFVTSRVRSTPDDHRAAGPMASGKAVHPGG